MRDNRIHYLDGLRGILALIVFNHHFLYLFFPELMVGGTPQQFFHAQGLTVWKLIAHTPLNVLFNPKLAINFFFLLSGFVQSYHYLKSENLYLLQTGLLKRYFRLALPMMAVLLIVFIFEKLHFVHKELIPADLISQGWVKGQMPDNLTFFQLIRFGLFDCFLGNRGYYQVLWTMPVELINSWLVLILLFATHKIRQKNILFLVWILVQIFLDSGHGISFTAGMLLCSLHLNAPAFNRVTALSLVKYGCLAAGLYFSSFPIIEYEGTVKKTMYRFIMIFDGEVYNYVIGNILLFCFLLSAPGLKRLLSKQAFQFFGSISYMFYLVHFLLLFSFSPLVFEALKATGLATDLLVTFLLSFTLTTLVSYILYRYIDKPVLRAGNTYSRRLLGI